MHTLEDHHGVMRVPAGAASEAQACRAVRHGLVIRPLPGVIMDGALAGHPGAWLRAVHLWRPDAVLDGRAALAARVRAVPEKGKANKALIQLLAKAAGVAPSSVSLISGDTSRVKVLQVVGDPRRLIELAGETAQKNG